MQHSAGQMAENTSGNLVVATMASRSESYVCQSCKQKVVLRKGKTILKSGNMMVTHFAHSVTNAIKCSGYKGGETVVHLEAKWLLAKNIEDFRFVMQSCDTCQTPDRQYCIKFTKDRWGVLVEGQVAGTGAVSVAGGNVRSRLRRADVLVQMKDPIVSMRLKPWYSLEVKHSHAVSVEKTKELHSVNCGIIEVLAHEVLEFKNILESDKPCYLRNRHTTGCIPWTCQKCMERVATERAARWSDYEEWYTEQWHHQDSLMLRASKRKRVQGDSFQTLKSRKPTRFENSTSKCQGRCVACKAWIYHKHFHTFEHDDTMTGTESWWRDAIRKDQFLSGLRFVNKMKYCHNCVGRCFNCKCMQPLGVLTKYALCRFCNTSDCWFDQGCPTWRRFTDEL
jgi:hypothetical protein